MRIKTSLLVTASALALSTSAFAADIQARPAAAQAYTAAPAMPNWTGPYVGVAVGGAQTRSAANVNELFVDEGYARPYDDHISANAPLASLYLGWNWQVGSLVYGLEGDLSFLNAESNNHFNYVDSYYDGVLRLQVKGLWTARARLGYAVDNALLYITAGFAGAKIDQSYSVAEKGIRFQKSGTKTGFVWGGGIEYMLSKHIAVRAEGLATHFSGGSVNDSDGYFASGIQANFKSTDVYVARIGTALKW